MTNPSRLWLGSLLPTEAHKVRNAVDLTVWASGRSSLVDGVGIQVLDGAISDRRRLGETGTLSESSDS